MILDKAGAIFEYESRKFMVGDQIVANGESAYEGLIGTITEIRDGEDKDTENDTPDIYCRFDEPVTPYEIHKLEKRFSDLYQCQKSVDVISLDLVIMAPDMIKTIKEIEDDKVVVSVFVITEDWAEQDDSGVSTWLAPDIASAKQKMNLAIKEAIQGGGIFDMRGEDDIQEDSSELSYEIYSEGFYCSSHYSINIKEEVLSCTPEFFKKMPEKLQKLEDGNKEAG